MQNLSVKELGVKGFRGDTKRFQTGRAVLVL